MFKDMARVKGHHLRWTRVCQSASIINNLDLGCSLENWKGICNWQSDSEFNVITTCWEDKRQILFRYLGIRTRNTWIFKITSAYCLCCLLTFKRFIVSLRWHKTAAKQFSSSQYSKFLWNATVPGNFSFSCEVLLQ